MSFPPPTKKSCGYPPSSAQVMQQLPFHQQPFHEQVNVVCGGLAQLCPNQNCSNSNCPYAHSIRQLDLTEDYARLNVRKGATTDQVCKNDVFWIQSESSPLLAIPVATGFERFKYPINSTISSQIRLLSDKLYHEVDAEQRNSARKMSNIFELIPLKEGILRFISRAGANLEEILHKTFILNVYALYFADLCGGPGAFADCLVKRFGGRCRGFGITLNTEGISENFKYRTSLPNVFSPYYGSDGDVTKAQNIIDFSNFVMQRTGNAGVHLVVANGKGNHGKSQDQGQCDKTIKLYLGQFALALSILRVGGDFVCKIFGTADQST